MSDRIHFPGLIEEVRPFLAAMDVYMMSSIFEGLPVALLEAMSMRCTPVCTGVGGIAEVIRSGENGFVTHPERPEQLAEVVGSLLMDRERSLRLGVEARATVEERFSMRRMTEELEALYARILDGRQNGR
jgi:glycosyltransferase involved in cell wall biosynthesis